MSLLATHEIKALIEPNNSSSVIKWTNKQQHILCVECDKSINPSNISMLYKCDGIDTYTLYCVCNKCVTNHIKQNHIRHTNIKIQSIRKQNKLQQLEYESNYK